MRAPSIAIAVLAASALVFTSIASAKAQTKVPVRAAYVPAVTWLPAWVAKEKGIFEKHGLDVSLTEIQNLGLLPSTLGKQFDVAPTTPPDLIKASVNGIDVVAIAGGFIESSKSRSIEVMVRGDSPIKKPADLAGKLIATPALGSIMHVSTVQWLKKNGVAASAIRAVEVPFPNMLDQLKNGRVDAAEAIQPFVGVMKKNGYVSLGDPVLSIADPAMGTMWIADRSWASAHKDAVRGWIASLTEAIAAIKAKPDDMRGIIAKYTKLPAPVVAAIPIPEYQATIAPKDLETWVGVLRDMGQIPAAIPAERLVFAP